MNSCNDNSEAGPSIDNHEISTDLPSKNIAAPLTSIRGDVLCVSDFTRQMWCEKQLVLALSSPPDKLMPKSRDAIRGRVLHRERDCEIHNYIDVEIESWEDDYGIKILRLIQALYEFRHVLSSSQREVPVFGVINGVLVLGTIDELRLDDVDFNIELVEFKTKRYRTSPGMSECKKHSIQTMLYKHMFDDIIRGKIPWKELRDCGRYDFNVYLNKYLCKYISEQMGFLKEIPDYKGNDKWNLYMLFKAIPLYAEGLPFINRCFIDYTWQTNEQTFLLQEVHYDPLWLKSQLDYCMIYWNGEREAQGVDIEESWKCRSCEVNHLCSFEHERRRLRERHCNSEEDSPVNRHRRRDEDEGGCGKRRHLCIEYERERD